MSSYSKLLRKQADESRARRDELAIQATEAKATAADPTRSRRERRDADYTGDCRAKLARAHNKEARKREDILAIPDGEPDE